MSTIHLLFYGILGGVIIGHLHDRYKRWKKQ